MLKIVAILGLSLLAYFVNVEGHAPHHKHHHKDPKCVCPNTTVNARTDAEIQAALKAAVTTVLNKKIPNTSQNAMKWRQMMLSMINSEDFDNRTVAAMSAATLLYDMNDFLIKPSGCQMAEYINGTVMCYGSQHSTHNMDKALSQAQLEATDFWSYSAIKANAASGCIDCTHGKCTKKANTGSCYKNGFAADLAGAWTTKPSNTYHAGLSTLVQTMFKSKNYQDQRIALVTTYYTSPLMTFSFMAGNTTNLIEMMNLEMSSSIPKCCCDARSARIKELRLMETTQKTAELNMMKTMFINPLSCGVTPF